jgi:hypothetical protein
VVIQRNTPKIGLTITLSLAMDFLPVTAFSVPNVFPQMAMVTLFPNSLPILCNSLAFSQRIEAMTSHFNIMACPCQESKL